IVDNVEAAATRWNEDVQERPGGAVIAEHAVVEVVGHIEIAVRPKADAVWILKAAAASRDEGTHRGARDTIEAENLGRIEATHVQVAVGTKNHEGRVIETPPTGEV